MPFKPLGSAQYVGAGAVVALTDTPTNSAGFGVTITALETALNAAAYVGDPVRHVGSMAFSLEGGAAHILTTGQTPTAAIGIAYAAGVYEWDTERLRLDAFKAYLPVGVTLNVEYGQ